MELLKSLGVDSTLWIQLVCFLVSYLAFSNLILKPYAAALAEREKRTIGSEEAAVRLLENATDLESEYEVKARSLHSKIKSVYDQSRSEAGKECDRRTQLARAEATEALERSRAEISNQIVAARKALSSEVPAIGAVIASKLAGKEISL
jgi:F0F1-type ATP synthase membrane subunit b/b'